MNPILREQACWGLIAAACTLGLYISLSAYTAELENPAPMLWGMFAAHALRMFFSVIHDMHRHSMKEIGLLSIAAVAGVWMAMVIRPAVLGAIVSMEAEPEIATMAGSYREYLAVVHNKVFGIPVFFLASYMMATKALRWIGSKWKPLEYPRSSYEMFGAFYETASWKLQHQVMVEVEAETKSLLADTQGRFKVPSPNRLL